MSEHGDERTGAGAAGAAGDPTQRVEGAPPSAVLPPSLAPPVRGGLGHGHYERGLGRGHAAVAGAVGGGVQVDVIQQLTDYIKSLDLSLQFEENRQLNEHIHQVAEQLKNRYEGYEPAPPRGAFTMNPARANLE